MREDDTYREATHLQLIESVLYKQLNSQDTNTNNNYYSLLQRFMLDKKQIKSMPATFCNTF